MPKNHYYNSNMKEKVDRKQQSPSLCIASEYGSKCQMTYKYRFIASNNSQTIHMKNK